MRESNTNGEGGQHLAVVAHVLKQHAVDVGGGLSNLFLRLEVAQPSVEEREQIPGHRHVFLGFTRCTRWFPQTRRADGRTTSRSTCGAPGAVLNCREDQVGWVCARDRSKLKPHADIVNVSHGLERWPGVWSMLLVWAWSGRTNFRSLRFIFWMCWCAYLPL